MKRIEILVENIILASRWLLVVFYLALALALAIYAFSFGGKLIDFVTKVTVLDETDIRTGTAPEGSDTAPKGHRKS